MTFKYYLEEKGIMLFLATLAEATAANPPDAPLITAARKNLPLYLKCREKDSVVCVSPLHPHPSSVHNLDLKI